MRLRAALAERGLSPKHAQDLLAAFKLDVTKLRYRDWDDLIGYCSLSAMPVGRFVLDVHGESRATWPANRCPVRRIADHQSSAGLRPTIAISTGSIFRSMHSPPAGSASSRWANRGRRRRFSPACTALPNAPNGCCRESDVFPAQINDWRLALEVSVINTLGASPDPPADGARPAARPRASATARRSPG